MKEHAKMRSHTTVTVPVMAVNCNAKGFRMQYKANLSKLMNNK